MKTTRLFTHWMKAAAVVAFFFTLIHSPVAKVLDDFDDNKVTGWEKFDFGSGNGFLKEEDGQFTIGMYQAPKQPFFVAATFDSQTYTIQDGVTLEFRIDLIEANQPEAYAAVGFIPKDTPVSQLSGYSAVKDNGDVILAKGLNKFFYDITDGVWTETPENITLSISMTGKGESVVMTVKILDIENNNAVLFEQTSIDTPDADDFQTGTDSPAGPFLGKPGNFVLLLYHNDTNGSLPASTVTLDNAKVFQYESATLDDFNDGKVTDWEKFDFGSGNGILKEEEGKLNIGMHQAPGQPFFVAATYEAKTFTIEDGTTIEFSVDLIGANQPDSFAVLSFIPKDNPVSTLIGYSLAKDINDILLAKGLGKYFYDKTEGDWIEREENIRLVLSMTGTGNSVEVTTRVLDLENNQAVLFEETVIDTVGVDNFETGDADDPPASFIGKPGNFVLLLYHNDTNGSLPASSVTFDNAHVSVFGSVSENQPPIITAVSPAISSMLLPASTKITFGVNDDQGIEPDGISVTLNGTIYTSGNGLTVGGTATAREVSLGGLTAGVNYHAVITVTDVDGKTDTRNLYFDTFSRDNLMIESEDYNFEGWDDYGEFIDDPKVVPEFDENEEPNSVGGLEDSYIGQEGEPGIDFFDTNSGIGGPTHRYRPNDGVSTVAALDLPRPKFIEAGGANKGVVDFGVCEIAEGEWLNYTRTFKAGHYEVYLRQSIFDIASTLCTLERVTSATNEEEQTTEVLGSFLGRESGVEFRNTPLTDGLGLHPVVVSLSGKSTLRLTQHSTDANGAYWYQNYLLFRPVADPGKLRPLVIDGAPLPGSSVGAADAGLSVTVMDRQTKLDVSSVKVAINGEELGAEVSTEDGISTISLALDPLPPSGESLQVQLSYGDQDGVRQVFDWSFHMVYSALSAEGAGLPGSGSDPGFDVRLVQAPLELNLNSSLARAEAQLAEGSDIEAVVDSTAVAEVINYSQDVDGSSGNFPNDTLFPGIDPEENHDNMAMETLTHLELSAGIHQFGVVADDSFKVESGGQVIGIHDGGSSTTQFEFVVPKDGVYPFRMVWEETGGSAHLEWYSIDLDTGTKVLINDPKTADSIKAYRTMAAPPPLTVQSASAVTGPYAADDAAVIDTVAGTAVIPLSGNARFYRLSSASALKISSIQVANGKVTLKYE